MPFVAFDKLCLETAERETRTIILQCARAGLPAGSYQFLEMFCDESGCDCRRVMFSVFGATAERQNPQRSSATGDHAGRVGRNHPCPCGSGKKFKLCCMK